MPLVYWSILFAVLLPVMLSGLSGYYRQKYCGVYDNNYPREQSAQLTGWGARAYSAQQNSWESLITYCASVFVAISVGVLPQALAIVAGVYMLARTLFCVCYLCNWATARSLVYLVGLGCCLYMFYLAAVTY